MFLFADDLAVAVRQHGVAASHSSLLCTAVSGSDTTRCVYMRASVHQCISASVHQCISACV